ncbi:hypothetical protein [Marinithermus hydrothermalis]|uniref:Cytochrome oxidase Caa3-type subunit IV domain-containing protein n=1 Tax=Marinithermus hydrothermalis (strain DSM 14884 / JCM 11576 / T1) TaxID=869210 RepID=F2NNB9_MARHT|nr:hypothetical protein [Marinithermus hydrothermalis]AEB10960.1 hypothetical protein Marky_0199 [Marinithermus hydrothermalis DSM 14884]
MSWVWYVTLFFIGSLVVGYVLYVALSPRSVAVEGENVDLRFIGFVLALIILAAFTISAMLILGKIDEIAPPL